MFRKAIYTIATAVGALAFASAATVAAPVSKNQYEAAYDRIVDQVRDSYLADHKIDWAQVKATNGAHINSVDELRKAVATSLKAGGNLKLLSQSEADALESRLRTSVVSAGLSLDPLTLIDRAIRVTGVSEDSTAADANLKSGDEITAVNGVIVDGKQLYDVIKLIGGEVGTYVKLSIMRDGQPLMVSVQRDLDGRIGAQVEPVSETKVFVVKYIDKEGPAAKAGLSNGDTIIGIQGQTTQTLSLSAALDAINNGRAGTTVTVRTKRDLKVSDVKITRDYIRSETLAFDMRGSYTSSYGYLLLTLRALDDPWLLQSLDAYISYFGSEDIPASGMVIDLRNTRGDNPDLAAQIAARFVTDGPLFSYSAGSGSNQYKVDYAVTNGQLTKTYTGAVIKTETVPLPADMVRYYKKVVVAVNGDTSGTAEALALALQATGRATITGAPTEAKPVLYSDIREAVDANETLVVTAPSRRLAKPDGSTITGVTPDTRIWYDGDIIDTALTQVDGQTWRSVENRTTIVAIAAAFVSLLVVGIMFLVSRKTKDLPEQEAERDETPEEQETPEQKAQSRRMALGTLLAPLLLIGALFGIKTWFEYSRGAPAGTHAELLVVAYVDDSTAGKMQAKVINELASEYKGDIKFQVIDASVHPELAVHPYFGKVDSFPRISLHKDWVDSAGNRKSESQGLSPPMTKRDLVQFIESRSKSLQAYWPDAKIERTRRSHP